MKDIVKWLDGKKTKLVAIGMIVNGLIQMSTGDVTGGINQVLLGALGFFGRQALAKVAK